MSHHGDALAPVGSPADALRAWGLAHPAVAFLLGVLPQRGDAPTAEERDGRLTVEVVRAPWVSVKSELRVALVRLVAALPRGDEVLGQVHVTERTDARGATHRRLRAYVHDGGAYRMREAADLDRWWLAVLERHYALGGDAVDLEGHAPASP